METLWRYMDTTKFESILKNKGLFYSRASKFDDNREGYYIPHEFINHIKENVQQVDSSRLEELFLDMNQRSQNTTYISCWHKSNAESEYMWKNYGGVAKGEMGIAIKSSIFSLMLATPASLGEVIEHKDCVYTSQNNEGDSHNSFTYKGVQYYDEQEFRAIVSSSTLYGKTGLNLDNCPVTYTIDKNGDWVEFYKTQPQTSSVSELITPISDVGIIIKHDISSIIHQIYLSPLATKNFEQEIRDIIDRHGYQFEISYSNINIVQLL